MRQSLQTRAFERVRPILQPGEEPVVAARAIVGPFSSARLAVVGEVPREEASALAAALVPR